MPFKGLSKAFKRLTKSIVKALYKPLQAVIGLKALTSPLKGFQKTFKQLSKVFQSH